MKTQVIALFLTCSTICAMTQPDKGGAVSYPYEVEIKQIEPFQYLYYEYKGAYMDAFKDFPKLVEYIENKNIKAGSYSLGVYYDDPAEVAESDLRSEIGMVVKEEVKSDKYKYKKVDGFKAVTIKYKKMEQIQPAYDKLMNYIFSKNLTPAGPSYEFYYSYDETSVDAEIIFPIK